MKRIITHTLQLALTSALTLLTHSVSAQGSGHALNFDGASYLSIPPSPLFDFGASTDDFTIEAWFTNDGVNGGYHDRIVASGLDATDSWQIAITNVNNEIWFGDGPVEKVVSYSSTALRSGEWVHVAITHTGSTTRLLINGIVVDENTSDNKTYSGGNGVAVGAYPQALISNTTLFDWNGKIDEVRIWNIGLSDLTIKENMCQKLNGSEANLVAYYRMDEGIDNTCSGGEDVCDLTGNGNHGTKF